MQLKKNTCNKIRNTHRQMGNICKTETIDLVFVLFSFILIINQVLWHHQFFSILKNNFEVEIQLHSLYNFLIYVTQSLIIFTLSLSIPTVLFNEKLKIKQRLRKQGSQTSGKMRSSSLCLIHKKGREIVFHSLIFKRIENSNKNKENILFW